ncbi:MAG: NAD(P)-binding domain-containing protein [Candidatus Paceibacterota bacterium]|jgi:UDPglucose 6-dehydrogenase
MKNTKPTIGFIGQGWIGKNYADNFEERGYKVVRYSREEPYIKNKEKIAKCDIVFIAVPTPTTPQGFSDAILRKVLPLVGKGKIAVIKSTLLPGTTARLQKKNPNIIVLHSPEFLMEANAKHNTDHPDRNIVGIPLNTDKYKKSARRAIDVMPKAPYELVCSGEEAELVKYGGNCLLYVKVVFANIFHDLSQKFPGVKYETVRDAMSADPRIGNSHLDPIHKSGRGAGGHCFIKDFAAFSSLYEKIAKDPHGTEALRAFEKKNRHLLQSSGKDLDLLRGVYGEA